MQYRSRQILLMNLAGFLHVMPILPDEKGNVIERKGKTILVAHGATGLQNRIDYFHIMIDNSYAKYFS